MKPSRWLCQVEGCARACAAAQQRQQGDGTTSRVTAGLRPDRRPVATLWLLALDDLELDSHARCAAADPAVASVGAEASHAATSSLDVVQDPVELPRGSGDPIWMRACGWHQRNARPGVADEAVLRLHVSGKNVDDLCGATAAASCRSRRPCSAALDRNPLRKLCALNTARSRPARAISFLTTRATSLPAIAPPRRPPELTGRNSTPSVIPAASSHWASASTGRMWCPCGKRHDLPGAFLIALAAANGDQQPFFRSF